MALPSDVEQLVDVAAAAADRDMYHQLRPILRKSIYELLAAKPPLGAHARIWLDILTAQHVAPLWTRDHGDDRMNHLIELAKGVIYGTVEKEIAADTAGRIWEWLSNSDGQREERLSR